MKKLLLVLTAICFLAVSGVYSKGIFIPPGTRANTMGEAYVGVADDLTAIYWNPAGLTRQDGPSAEASFFYATPAVEGNVSLNNAADPDAADGDFPIPNMYEKIGASGIEPGTYDSKELETGALIPFAAGGTQINGFSLAVGLYGSGGGGGLFEDEIEGVDPDDTIEAKVDGQYSFLVSNISVARDLNQELSVGLGLNYIYMQDELEVSKSFDGSGSGSADYEILMEKSASGSGIEVTGGVMYNPIEGLNIGLVLRSGAAIELSGTGKYKTEGIETMTGGSVPDAAVETDYSQDYVYPMTFGMGASYQMTDALLVSGGVDFNRYSAREINIDYDTEVPGIFEDADGVDEEWDDTVQLRLGAEYLVNERLALRGGIYTDPTGAPTDDVTLINTDQFAMTGITVGAGYSLAPLQVDIGLGYGISDTPSKGDREYEYPVLSLRTSVGYSF